MTLDERGNVYLTGRGVTIFHKTGSQIATIPVSDVSWTGNLCFGGADRQTLFITASKGFYALKMNVKGTVFPKPIVK
jgi:gluconolactonase